METLVALLFVVFSIGSALLERRKRRQQVEQGRKAFQEREARRQSEETEEPKRFEFEEEEEEEWSFPDGGFDPFALEEPKPAQPDPELEEIQQQQRLAEQLAAQAEQKARELAEQTQRLQAERQNKRYTKRNVRRKGRLVFEQRSVRDAIVYAEILGKPKALRDDED